MRTTPAMKRGPTCSPKLSARKTDTTVAWRGLSRPRNLSTVSLPADGTLWPTPYSSISSIRQVGGNCSSVFQYTTFCASCQLLVAISCSWRKLFRVYWPELDPVTHGAQILVITGASFRARCPRGLQENVQPGHQADADLSTEGCYLHRECTSGRT